ncbi:hypothetical protein CL628_03515 [bacterium]|nr:hypothetical protein [bacterium]|tara:strand:- start:129 stop:380 length:252 start_codon:yes stop_codon:yes gene_type:complete
MITFLGFLIGLIMVIIGFFAVAKTQWFLRNLGDLGEAFGAIGATWMSWKVFGLIFMGLGFAIAFDLFGRLFGGVLTTLFSIGP